MRKKTILLVVSILLQVVGIGIIGVSVGWMPAVGLFVFAWGQNMSSNYRAGEETWT